jgi:hypothetical protein
MYAVIRAGVRASIRGGDVGKRLVQIVKATVRKTSKRCGYGDSQALPTDLENTEGKRSRGEEASTLAAYYEDMAYTLFYLIASASSVKDCLKTI